jgi:hypothetical protein
MEEGEGASRGEDGGIVARIEGISALLMCALAEKQ